MAVLGTAAPWRTMTGVLIVESKERRSRYHSVASAERAHAAPRTASKDVCVKEESIHSSDKEMQRLVSYVLRTMRRHGEVENVSFGPVLGSLAGPRLERGTVANGRQKGPISDPNM